MSLNNAELVVVKFGHRQSSGFKGPRIQVYPIAEQLRLVSRCVTMDNNNTSFIGAVVLEERPSNPKRVQVFVQADVPPILRQELGDRDAWIHAGMDEQVGPNINVVW